MFSSLALSFAKFFHCMGYPLGKVAWLWLFLIQNILGLFQHMSNTTPPPWGLTLTGTSVEIVCRLVNWLIENVHSLVIIYKSCSWLCFGCVSIFHVVQAAIFQNIYLWYSTRKWQTIHERISHLKFLFLFSSIFDKVNNTLIMHLVI